MEAALDPGVHGVGSDNYHEMVNNLAARHCEDTQVREDNPKRTLLNG